VVFCEAADEQKRKASTGGEQTSRAFFAKSALMWAIASGFLAFYGESVIWARRFVRDPVSSVNLKIYRHEKTVAFPCASNRSLGWTRLLVFSALSQSCGFFRPELEAISSLLLSPTVVFLTGLDADAFPIHSLFVAFLR
jgi:hypothetical protein